jgi:hypothetical protein
MFVKVTKLPYFRRLIIKNTAAEKNKIWVVQNKISFKGFF